MHNVRNIITANVPSDVLRNYGHVVDDVIEAVEEATASDALDIIIADVLVEHGLESYSNYAAPVVRALREARFEQGGDEESPEETPFEDFRAHAAQVIRHHAANYGLQEHAVEAVLIEANLVDEEPEPEPEPEVTSEDTVADIARRVEATLNEVRERVEGLTAFARRNGYTG